jgi:hypothetical protein
MVRTSVSPVSDSACLGGYLEGIRRFRMLTPEEEFALAKRWREHGDRDAGHKLVTSHLRLVAKIAMGYRGYGLPISDIISEGNVGLMQAVKRFQPEKGFSLTTYAMAIQQRCECDSGPHTLQPIVPPSELVRLHRVTCFFRSSLRINNPCLPNGGRIRIGRNWD